MTPNFVKYKAAINEAIAVKRELTALAQSKIGVLLKRPVDKNMTEEVKVVAVNMLLGGGQLSGQILDALSRRHIQISVIGLRALFEMFVNTKYIYDHPDHQKDFLHMNKVCKDYIFRSNSKYPKVIKSKLDEETIKNRMHKLNLQQHYESDYTEMCEWAHLMSKNLNLNSNEEGFVDFGIRIASYDLTSLSNLVDSLCAGLGMRMSIKAEQMIVDFQTKNGIL